MSDLKHFGVLGMKWGVRKERKAAERAERKDIKWTTRGKGAKITAKAERSASKEAEAHARATVGSPRTSSGRISMTYMNQYNQKLAQIMNNKIGDVPAPSGRILRYVAKRGELGVHTALADQGYNMNQVAKGIHASGRIAYKKETVRRA